MLEVKSEQAFATLVSGSHLTLVDFAAKWCGPCKSLAPRLEILAMRYPLVRFVKVDVDTMDGLASKYQISAMPTILLFRKGSVVARVVGADDRKIEDAIKKNM